MKNNNNKAKQNQLDQLIRDDAVRAADIPPELVTGYKGIITAL